MATETDLLRLAVAAYEAASDQALWPAFLERYAEALDADAAFLHLHHFGSGQSEVLASARYDSRLKQSYHEYYSKVNLWRDRARKLYRSGLVLLEEEICPRAATMRSEFYNDYLLRMGVTRSMGPVISRVEQHALTIPAMRVEHKEPFDEEQRDFVRRLLPHLARANLIRERLEILQAGEEVLDGLAFGIAFLTAEGRVLHVNRAAESIFRQEDGLGVRAGVLSVQTRGGDSALKWAVRQAGQRPQQPERG
jgi:PAS domain-containing protein